MKLEMLIAKHEERSRRPKSENHLRRPEYRQHYPLIREAVLKGVPLWSAIEILRSEENAFVGMKTPAVWQAFRRALKSENIILSEIPK